MFHREKPTGVPPVPPNLNASSWEMVDLQDESKPKLRPHAYTIPDATPYLGLRARLSQIWFNRWTVLLILVMVRVVLLTGSLNGNISDAKVKALSACTKVEDIGSTMASMPHYLSVGVNALAAKGVTSAVHAMVRVLELILEATQALIFFIINLVLGTYLCLITALIHGAMDVATAAIEGTTDLMNDAIGTITTGLANDISSVQSTINEAYDSTLGRIFGPAPKILDDGRLDDLTSIKIDTSKVVGGLATVNKTVPTFDEVEKAAKDALSFGFNLVKEQVTNKFGNYSFDKDVFPKAEKQALSFCSNNSFLNDFFNGLFEIVAKAKVAFMVVIPILAVLAMVVMGYLEIRRWRREKARAKFFTEQGYDPVDVVYIASRPMMAGVGIKLASRFSGKKNVWVRWAIAYGTSLPALFVLALAIAGFFSCLCQFILMRAIEKEAPALANQVGNFAGDVVSTLQKVSTDWSNDANGVIIELETDINRELFGWMGQATNSTNNTLEAFDNTINTAITNVFKDTPLLNVARNLVGCLIGRKIDAVQKALTFLQENAKVTLPRFDNDTFSQGADDSVNGDGDLTSFLASPATVTTDEVTDAVASVIRVLHNGLVQEALISLGLLLVYVIIVLIGVVRALVGMAGPDKTRAEGGQRFALNIRRNMTPVEDTQTDFFAPEKRRRAPPPPPVVPGVNRNRHNDDEDVPSPAYDYVDYSIPASKGRSAPDKKHRRAPSPPSVETDAPDYDDVVYQRSVTSGRRGPAQYPSHARKSSYPELDDVGR